MTEKKALYRTHAGKVLHAQFSRMTLKLDGGAARYEVKNRGDGKGGPDGALYTPHQLGLPESSKS